MDISRYLVIIYAKKNFVVSDTIFRSNCGTDSFSHENDYNKL